MRNKLINAALPKPPKPPKIELVKEDYNPIKALQGPHSAHSLKPALG